MQRYLSPRQVYKEYGIETKKIYWWIRNNTISFVKTGKSVLIPEKELIKFLSNHTVEPVTEERIEGERHGDVNV